MTKKLAIPQTGIDPQRNPLMRKRDVRRVRALANEFRDQMNRELSASEEILLANAATLALMCERNAHAILLNGGGEDTETYRRNLQALRAMMISLGLAKKSRDIKKGDFATGSILGQLIEQ